jgi:predicted N-formylglutamate amidohydrolase
MSVGDLGLTVEQQRSHIGWGPGALPLARMLSALLDATLISQSFSRLVYDCNRPPEAESAVPKLSEIHAIPGNVHIPREQRVARVQ